MLWDASLPLGYLIQVLRLFSHFLLTFDWVGTDWLTLVTSLSSMQIHTRGGSFNQPKFDWRLSLSRTQMSLQATKE